MNSMLSEFEIEFEGFDGFAFEQGWIEEVLSELEETEETEDLYRECEETEE